MTITRDCEDLVGHGFISIFPAVRALGKLVMITIFLTRVPIAWACMPVLVVPLLLFFVLKLRQQITLAMRKQVFSTEDALVAQIHNTVQAYQIIADYQKRSPTIEAFEKFVAGANAAKKQAMARGVNHFFAPWMTTLLVGFFMAVGANYVEAGILTKGEFLAIIAMYKDLGQEYNKIYGAVLSMQTAFTALGNITYFMNLPIDVLQRKQMAAQRKIAEHQKEKTRNITTTLLHKSDSTRHAADMLLHRGFHLHHPTHTAAPAAASGHALAAAAEIPMIGGGQEQHPAVFAVDTIPIRLEGVTFNYKNEGQVFHDLELTIPQGRMVAVVGKHGAGKGSLLRLLGGVTHPQGGTVFVPPHLRVLHISQTPILLQATLIDNLTYGLENPKEAATPDSPLHSHLLSVLDQCGFTPHLIAKLNRADWAETSTSSEKLLVHVARALVADPEVLVMHRPADSLDDKEAAKLLRVLRRFVNNRGIAAGADTLQRRRPRTLIFTSDHNQGVSLADDVIRIDHGKAAFIHADEVSEEMLGFDAVSTSNLLEGRARLKKVKQPDSDPAPTALPTAAPASDPASPVSPTLLSSSPPSNLPDRRASLLKIGQRLGGGTSPPPGSTRPPPMLDEEEEPDGLVGRLSNAEVELAAAALEEPEPAAPSAGQASSVSP